MGKRLREAAAAAALGSLLAGEVPEAHGADAPADGAKTEQVEEQEALPFAKTKKARQLEQLKQGQELTPPFEVGEIVRVDKVRVYFHHAETGEIDREHLEFDTLGDFELNQDLFVASVDPETFDNLAMFVTEDRIGKNTIGTVSFTFSAIFQITEPGQHTGANHYIYGAEAHSFEYDSSRINPEDIPATEPHERFLLTGTIKSVSQEKVSGKHGRENVRTSYIVILPDGREQTVAFENRSSDGAPNYKPLSPVMAQGAHELNPDVGDRVLVLAYNDKSTQGAWIRLLELEEGRTQAVEAQKAEEGKSFSQLKELVSKEDYEQARRLYVDTDLNQFPQAQKKRIQDLIDTIPEAERPFSQIQFRGDTISRMEQLFSREIKYMSVTEFDEFIQEAFAQPFQTSENHDLQPADLFMLIEHSRLTEQQKQGLYLALVSTEVDYFTSAHHDSDDVVTNQTMLQKGMIELKQSDPQLENFGFLFTSFQRAASSFEQGNHDALPIMRYFVNNVLIVENHRRIYNMENKDEIRDRFNRIQQRLIVLYMSGQISDSRILDNMKIVIKALDGILSSLKL